MTRFHRARLAGALALALLVAGTDMVHAQPAGGSETDNQQFFGDIEAKLEASPEGGGFELLQSGDGPTRSLATGEGPIITLPIGEPEDRLPIYRTMCVRLCDGYYFPMSPASSRNDFARDQQNCRSICPGADTRIYYQLATEHDVDAMTSATTENPYSDLDTAYLYRRPGGPDPAACGCRGMASDSGYSVLGGDGVATIEQVPGSSIVYPDMPAAPEAAPRAEEDVVRLLRRTDTDVDASRNGKVRVVGPEYLPGQAAATVPPIPAPTAGR